MAKEFGVSRDTVRRARVPERVRKAEEFAIPVPRKPPRRTGPTHCWDLDQIIAARNAQMRGDFALAVKLAKAMRTDDAQFIAYRNRLAPQKAIAATLVPAPGARGEAVAKKAGRSVIAPRHVLTSIVGTLADHGIAIGYIERDTNEEGTRVNMRLTEWPLEFVKWNESREVLETRTRDAGTIDIVHGNGEYVVFRGIGNEPWSQEACIIPGALVWPSHAYGIRDWNSTAKSHGLAKLAAEMQEGVPLAKDDGTLHAQAESVLNTLTDLSEGEAGAGIFPHGAKPQVLYNGSNAWQIFDTLEGNRAKAFARIYLGTDAILGSVGGAPGIDIAELFRVASGIFQGDFRALEEGLRTGLYEPWTAINEGDSRLAPSLKYELPDPDENKRSEQEAAKLERVHTEIERRKKNGMAVTQEVVAELCKVHAVRAVPVLAPATQASVPITLAPTDFARVVRVDEARGSGGLPPIGGETGMYFLPELEAKQAVAAAPPPALATRAGTYDESKHPRADDGKFGQGAGTGGGTEEADTPEKARSEASSLLDDFKKQDDARTAEAKKVATEKKAEWLDADKKQKAAWRQVDKDFPEGVTDESLATASPEAKKRWENAVDLYDDAQDHKNEYDLANQYVKDAPKRKRVVARYEKAIAKGNADAANFARNDLEELLSDDTFASGSERHPLLDFDTERLVDADGDGRTGEAEENDDDEDA